ncbi:MAG: SGNH/GDSL hydrolase family protein [Pirellulales bacterium]|nr:SGNH/GDSL hydrolase family protein [Pirellulales bacterium]
MPSARRAPSHDLPATVRARRRGIWFRIAAMLLAVVVGCLVAEVGLRLFGIRPERYPIPKWLAWDGQQFREAPKEEGLIKRPSRFESEGVRMGEYTPYARFKVVYGSNPTDYFDADNSVLAEVNNLGLRGPDVAEEKPDATRRVLILGDSFTFGVGVRDEDTFARRLEADLNREAPSGERIEVINAGVQGYNTRDEVLYLEREWLRLAPDLVIIVFYLNDAYEDRTFLNMGEALGVYVEPYGLGRYSYLADLVQHEIGARRSQRALEEYYLQHYFRDARNFLARPGEVASDWLKSRAALDRAAQLLRERNIPLVLVLFPELHQLDASYPFAKVHDLVRATADELSVPVLDLLDVYRGQVDHELWVHPTDHHPNAEAHRLAAQALHDFLSQRKLP